jgi:WD40 repeat protein
MRFFPDGQRLLSANSTKIGVWNTSLGQIVRSLTKNEAPITSLCFSDNGSKFISADEKGGLVVWDAVSLTFFNEIKGKAPCRINDICFVPKTDYFFTALEDKSIILWKTDKGNRICSLDGHKGTVTALCISRDGEILISGDKFGEIRIWKSFDRKEAGSL